jgi:hypothetical protein
VAGALGNGFLVKALPRGDLSVLVPINSYKSVVGLITGIFLLSTMPNAPQMLGIVLIIWRSYFVLDTTEERFFLGPVAQKRDSIPYLGHDPDGH